MTDDTMGKLAILSYHSWDISPGTLVEDVAALREQGWTALSLEDSRLFIGARGMRGKFFLVSSDDGSAKDEEFVEALRQIDCPAVLFVNVGNIPEERLPFYRRLSRSGAVEVHDHGHYHRKQFVSSQVYDYVAPASRLGGLESMKLEKGMPVCVSGSELAAPRFIPDPDAMELAAETARLLPLRTEEANASRIIEEALLGKRLGYRRFGRFHLRGEFESAEQFLERVSGYLAGGQKEFAAKLGRLPEYFAYPWWQGGGATDAVLKELGYKASFAGVGFIQRQDGRLFGIPRIPVGPDTPRPIRLDLPCRPRFGKVLTERFRGVCKTALGIR